MHDVVATVGAPFGVFKNLFLAGGAADPFGSFVVGITLFKNLPLIIPLVAHLFHYAGGACRMPCRFPNARRMLRFGDARV